MNLFPLLASFLMLSAQALCSAEASKQMVLTKCEKLTRGDTTYILQNDVSSAGTCFPIEASGITLDLNGHTVLYGTGGGDAPEPAFSLCDGWYNQLSSSTQCGGNGHARFTVYGGTVTQATNAPPFSPVFWVGQGNGINGGHIHNITATFSSAGSQFFHGDYPGLGWKIQDNIINDNVTNIQHPNQGALSARSQLQGYAIKLDNGGTPIGPADDISGNTINGSPQGGISDGAPGSLISGNIIHLTSTYSNDYGIISMAKNQNIHGNTITGHGRGLDAEGTGFILDHNIINVQEMANNSEYGGCELGGTYGIRVKNYDPKVPSIGWSITNNNVTIPAGPCIAIALDMTNMQPAVTGNITGNTFTTVAGTYPDYVISLNSVQDLSGIKYSGNVFSGSTCLIINNNGDFGSPADTIIEAGQTWECPMGPTVVTTDLTKGQSNPWPVYLEIQDEVPNPTVKCGDYSTALVKIGSFTRQCQ